MEICTFLEMSTHHDFSFFDKFNHAVAVVNSAAEILHLNRFFTKHYLSPSNKPDVAPHKFFSSEDLISILENFSGTDELRVVLTNAFQEKKTIPFTIQKFAFVPGTFILIETSHPGDERPGVFIIIRGDRLNGKIAMKGVTLCGILGYEPEEFRTRDFFSLMHPDDVHDARHKLHSAIRMNSNNCTLTGRLQKKSGDYVWVENELHFVHSDPLQITAVSRDISESVAAQEELLNLKEYLKEVQTLAKIGNWHLNLDTEELVWTATMSRIYENDPDEAPRTGAEFFRFVHPDDYQYVGRHYRELFELKQQDYTGYKEIQFRIITAKGNLKHIKARFKVGSAHRSISGINIDVTAEVESEKKLRQSELNFYQLVDNFPLGVGVTKNHTRAFVNKKLAELFEVSPEEFIQYPLDAFADEQTGVLIRQRIADLKEGKKASNNFTGTFITKKTHKFKTIEIHTSEITWEGEPARLALAIDITELKAQQEKIIKSENMRRLAQEFAGITSWQIKLPNTFAESNELIRTMFEKRIHEDDRSYVYETFKKCQQGIAPYDVAFRIITDSGKTQWVAEKGNVVRNAEGKAIELYGVTRDITNEKIREQLLLHSKNMAEEAYKNQEAFFSFMSHEIRTPLNAILGLTNLLSRRQPPRKRTEIVKTLKNAGDNLMHVVDGLLDLTKSKAGNNTAAAVDFKLPDTLYQLESSYRFLAREKGIGFVLILDPNLPALLRGDVVKLYQVLNNLLDNAIKFTQQGFISLSVAAQKRNNKFIIEFRVEDTGVGIPADKLDQLFKPFHQLNFDTRKKGTGLGLAIVKNLVSQLEGTITVDSKLDKGSIFTLTVPFEPGSKPNVAKVKKNYSVLRGKRILYVEDVDTNQYLIQNLLKEYHAKCDVVSTGKQALIRLAKKNYDLLLLDIQLPDISGHELLDIAQTTLKAKSIPVIIFTADVTESTKLKILNQGIKDFLYKPFVSDDLLAKIIKVMKSHEDVSMDYYERLFRGNKTKLAKVKELVVSDLDELRTHLMRYVREKNIDRIKKCVHKAKVVVKNINALKLLKAMEFLESRQRVTPHFRKKYNAMRRELTFVRKKIAAYSF